MNSLDSKFFAGNRKQLRKELNLSGDSIVIVPANVRQQYHADQAHDFLQDSNFFYLTGINEADCLLVITEEYEWLFIPDQDEHAGQWDGQLSISDAQKSSGIDQVMSLTDGWKLLKRYLPRVNTSRYLETLDRIYLPMPDPYVSFDGVYANPARRLLLERLKQDFPMVTYEDVLPAIAQLRSIKQKPEIEVIKHAISITGKAMKDVLANVSHGTNEYEVEAGLAHGYRSRGAQGAAYRSIVAGAERACVLHYSDNDQPLLKGRLLLVDSAARVNNYAADITRTVPVNGKMNKRQEAVFDAVARVHEFAIKQLKPGVKLNEYEKAVEARMGQSLEKLGLIKKSTSENVRKYYPHATSHFLGLDVHDVGPRDAELKAGMVLTVEPGIYIPKESIGVRIEDNILITEKGAENLSGDIPQLF